MLYFNVSIVSSDLKHFYLMENKNYNKKLKIKIRNRYFLQDKNF